MPIRSRLLRLVIILAGLSSSALSLAIGDSNTIKAKSAIEASNGEPTASEFPFNNQSIPSASPASEPEKPATAPVAQVVESKAEKRTLGNNKGNNQCRSDASNAFQKSLLVTAFPRVIPNSSNAGSLADAEHQLPKLLSQQLEAKHNTLTPILFNESLPSATLSSDNLLAQQIQKLARSQRTQLVLSGEILDMTMTNPEATYNPGMYTRFLNGLFDFIEIRNRFDKRERLFSFNVNLRDGFTGQTLFSKRYDTYGIWGSTKEVGFDTPLFWKTDYGQQIKSLVKMAAKDVGEVVQCQPYIAQIDSRPGQTQILLQGGANNGLRSGDTLALYQVVVQGSETEYQQHQVRLVNRNTEIELREVYPSHSVGVISGTTYLTGQFLAVAQ